jgi:hypothetical protein
MSDYSSSYAYLNTLQTLVREGFVTKAIVDTFFTSERFFQEIRDLTDTQNGALALTWPVNIGKSSNTIAFSGGQGLPANSLDSFIRPSLGWKYYADALALNVTDLQQADSPEAIASLVDSQLDIVKMSLADRLAGDFITSTQAVYPLQLNGLAEAIDDGTVATTYANVSRTTYPTWKAIVNYDVLTSVNLINTLYGIDLQASQDGHRPNFYATTRLVYATIQDTLMALDVYNQPDMARTTGGHDLIFNGTPVVWDPHIPTGVATVYTGSAPNPNSGGYFYGINRSTIKYVVDPKMNFTVSDWLISTTTAQVIARILHASNLVVLRPPSNFVCWVQGG